MGWKESFVQDYAGPPLRVALNLYIVAAIGILVGHFGFGAPVGNSLVIGAMLPGLFAMGVAAWIKLNQARR